MTFAILKMAFSKTPVRLLQQGKDILAGMSDVVVFPAPPTTMAALLALLTQFENAITNAQSRDRNAIILRNQIQAELLIVLKNLAYYVSSVAAGNGAIITQAGFQLKASKSAPVLPARVTDVKTVASTDANTGEVKWKHLKNADSYEVQLSTDDESYTFKTVCTKARARFTDLPAGRVYFRIAAVGAAGRGEWSQPAWLLAA